MSCVLDRDASGKYDFTTKKGSTAMVKASAGNGNAVISAARLNSADIPIQSDGTVSLTFLAGINIVKLVVNVSDPTDTVKILEVCGTDTNTLEEFLNAPDDPVTGFSVFGF